MSPSCSCLSPSKGFKGKNCLPLWSWLKPWLIMKIMLKHSHNEAGDVGPNGEKVLGGVRGPGQVPMKLLACFLLPLTVQVLEKRQ